MESDKPSEMHWGACPQVQLDAAADTDCCSDKERGRVLAIGVFLSQLFPEEQH